MPSCPSIFFSSRRCALLAGVFVLVGIISAMLCNKLFADPLPPGEPAVPSVYLDRNEYSREATVSFEGGAVRTLRLIFDSGDFTIGNPSGGRRTISMDHVRTFRFIHWRRIRRNGEMLFAPDRIEITLHDGTMLRGDSSLDLLRKIRYRDEKGSGYLYTVFCDYWRDNRWINSGSTEGDYPLEHPLAGTVTEIRFSRGDGGPGLIEILGKSLDKRKGE